MLIALWWMRSGHLDVLRQGKEFLAHIKHPIYHFLGKAGIDEICKAYISTGAIELLADAFSILYISVKLERFEGDIQDQCRLQSLQSR
jgi:hypothetical protein